jgi:hypothetical protein
MPKDKAPGPDGFSINFFVKCWDIIKGELMSLIHAFHSVRHNFFFDILNTANIVLIPKKEGATSSRIFARSVLFTPSQKS